MSTVDERLARRAHDSWARWARWMLDSIERDLEEVLGDAQSEVIRALPCVKRWRRQMDTPYDELPASERVSDQTEAAEVAATLVPDVPVVQELVAAFKRHLDWGPAEVFEGMLAWLYRWSVGASPKAATMLIEHALRGAPWRRQG